MKVYTAITKGYDRLKEPPPSALSQGVEFWAFLDQASTTSTWRIQSATTGFSNANLNAKYHKILAHKCFAQCDCSVWIDGSIAIRPGAKILGMARRCLQNADIAVFTHIRRYCAYQEALHVLHKSVPGTTFIHQQAIRYTREGYPADHGLADCAVIMRRHTMQVEAFNELWWKEVQAMPGHERISFPYVAWKTGIKVCYLPPPAWGQGLFLRQPHEGISAA